MSRRGTLVLAVRLAMPAVAQTTPTASATSRPAAALSSHPDRPQGSKAATATIESTIAAFYSAISATAGGTLDRMRLRSLFVPGGRIAIGVPPRPGHPADVVFVSPDE